MIIRKPGGTTLLDIQPDDNTSRTRELMGQDTLTVRFSLAQAVAIPTGSTVELHSVPYTLFQAPTIKKQHARQYDYTADFHAPQKYAQHWITTNPIDHRTSYGLTAKPREHLQMIIDNLNQRWQGWNIGECITAPEQCIKYDHVTLFDALRLIADTFNTEFEITNGRTIHIHRAGTNTIGEPRQTATIAYGKGRGILPGLTRTNTDDTPTTEKLFVVGTSRNINRETYPADETLRAQGVGRLLMPRNTTIYYNGTDFRNTPAEGYTGYVTDIYGTSLTEEGQEDTFGPEAVEDLSGDELKIYPHRIGEVTSAEYGPLDFGDQSLTEDLDYNQLATAETAKIIFQDGQLAGREFEFTYNHGGNIITLIPIEEDGVTIPNDTIRPRQGDHYAVYNINLPPSYITTAEEDLLKEAVRRLHKARQPKATYQLTLDPLNPTNLTPRLAQTITIQDQDLGNVTARITAIKDYPYTHKAAEITISNQTKQPTLYQRIAATNIINTWQTSKQQQPKS